MPPVDYHLFSCVDGGIYFTPEFFFGEVGDVYTVEVDFSQHRGFRIVPRITRMYTDFTDFTDGGIIPPPSQGDTMEGFSCFIGHLR